METFEPWCMYAYCRDLRYLHGWAKRLRRDGRTALSMQEQGVIYEWSTDVAFSAVTGELAVEQVHQRHRNGRNVGDD